MRRTVSLQFHFSDSDSWFPLPRPILYDAVKNVTSQAISGHDGLYHILALQLGPTEKSNYYLYWFPACYVAAVKEELLGAWQSFMF